MPSTPADVFPRIYRFSLGTRLILWICIVLFLGGFGAVSVLASRERGGLDPRFLAVAWLLLALLGALTIRRTLLFRLTLTEDAVELRDVFPMGTRCLRREEIAGWRLQHGRGSNTLVLVPKRTKDRTVSVPLLFKVDTSLRDWLIAFPDLDREEGDGSGSAPAAVSRAESDAVTSLRGPIERLRRADVEKQL